MEAEIKSNTKFLGLFDLELPSKHDATAPLLSSNESLPQNKSPRSSPRSSMNRSSPRMSPRSSMHRGPSQKAPVTGRIHLQFLYNTSALTLTVKVIEADMKKIPANGECFARIVLKSDQSRLGHRKTKILRKEKVFQWNETLTPFKNVPLAKLLDESLKVSVSTRENKEEVILGGTMVHLGNIDFGEETVTRWFELRQLDKRVRLSWFPKKIGDKGEEEAASFVKWLGGVPATAEDSDILLWYKTKLWKDVHSMGPLLQDKQLRLAEALWEIFTSELHHLSTLEVLCDPFLSLLRRLKETNSGDDKKSFAEFAEDVDIEKLFQNIEELRDISKKFATGLKRIFLKEGQSSLTFFSDATEGLVHLVTELQNELIKPELMYRVKNRSAKCYLKQLQSSRGTMFDTYTEWCQEDPRCARMKLKDLLVQPLQRLPRYPLLLKAVLKLLPDNCQNELLQGCIKNLENALMQHNEEIQRHEGIEKLKLLECTLKMPPIADTNTKSYIPDSQKMLLDERPLNLRTRIYGYNEGQCQEQEEVREFIREGDLHLLNRHGRVSDQVQLHLLSDLVILSHQPALKARRSMRSPREGLKDTSTRQIIGRPFHIRELDVVNIADTNSVENSFGLIVQDGLGLACQFFSLKAPSSYAKTDWLKHLGTYIHSRRSKSKLRRTQSGLCLSQVSLSGEPSTESSTDPTTEAQPMDNKRRSRARSLGKGSLLSTLRSSSLASLLSPNGSAASGVVDQPIPQLKPPPRSTSLQIEIPVSANTAPSSNASSCHTFDLDFVLGNSGEDESSTDADSLSTPSSSRPQSFTFLPTSDTAAHSGQRISLANGAEAPESLSKTNKPSTDRRSCEQEGELVAGGRRFSMSATLGTKRRESLLMDFDPSQERKKSYDIPQLPVEFTRGQSSEGATPQLTKRTSQVATITYRSRSGSIAQPSGYATLIGPPLPAIKEGSVMQDSDTCNSPASPMPNYRRDRSSTFSIGATFARSDSMAMRVRAQSNAAAFSSGLRRIPSVKPGPLGTSV